MDKDFTFLMSVYNDIEAENVVGILELEGIEARKKAPKSAELINIYAEGSQSVDIYVHGYNYDKARQVIEVEMVRGDF